MSTERSFQDMLNEYLPDSLLKEELIKRDYVFNRIEKDQKWKGGTIPVPFKAAGASSVKFGGLTSSNDIAQSQYIRGEITAYKEVWGSMLFNHRDLLDHNGRVKEDGFIKVLPDTIEDFMEYIKMCVSIQLTGGPHFATVTDATDAATGIMVVDRVDRFCLGQKCTLDDDDSVALSVYVTAIDLNTNKVTFSATRGGAAVDISAYTVAQNAVFYFDGVTGASSTFVSLKSAFLSAANGGSANIHGKSKLAYPFLQAINIDGSAVDADNILEKLFLGYADIRQKARGHANEIMMSYKHFGSCMIAVEGQKGAYKVTEGSETASEYGWTTIEITVVATNKKLKLVGIQEMDDDIILFMDWSAVVFRSNGLFRKRTAPDGKQYYEVRNDDGFVYILDVSLFGEMEIKQPGRCGIMHTISY